MDASEHGAQADNTLPCFGISEVADMTGISAFTIRYYDKCGFFPELARDASGLSIEGIQYYVKLQRRGAATRDERLAIVRAQETVLEYQRAELDESLKRLSAAGVELSTDRKSR